VYRQHRHVCTNGRLGWKERQIKAQSWNMMGKCETSLTVFVLASKDLKQKSTVFNNLWKWIRMNLLTSSKIPSIHRPIPPLAILLLLQPFFGAKKNSENQTLFYAICARFFSSFRLWFFGMMIPTRREAKKKGQKEILRNRNSTRDGFDCCLCLLLV
jgi:hypothetical protein